MSGNKDPKLSGGQEQRTVTIGERTYQVADFNADSRKVLSHVDMTDTHIRDLEARLAIARTARAKYIQSLKQSLESR